jgi:hypothetical protein
VLSPENICDSTEKRLKNRVFQGHDSDDCGGVWLKTRFFQRTHLCNTSPKMA